MAVGITIEVRGTERVRQRLENLSGPDMMRKLHDRIAQRIKSWVVRNFEAGGLERRWEPLRPNTIYGRRMSGKGGGVQPLRSGGPGTPMIQTLNSRATSTEATIGFGSKIAVFHHWGTHGPYPIRARFKQALAFPSLWTRGHAQMEALGPLGPANLFNKRRPYAKPIGKAKVGALWQTKAQGTRPGAMNRMTSFQKAGRGRREFSSLNFMVVRGVMHPGLPPRPLLPSPGLARQIAAEVAQGLIQELTQARGGA